jgi:hypothetical protein
MRYWLKPVVSVYSLSRNSARFKSQASEHTAAVVVLDHGEFFSHGKGGVVLDPGAAFFPRLGNNHCHVISALDKCVFLNAILDPIREVPTAPQLLVQFPQVDRLNFLSSDWMQEARKNLACY